VDLPEASQLEVDDTGIGLPLGRSARCWKDLGQIGNILTAKPEGGGLVALPLGT
jgi:hypothetical protein